MTNWQLPVHGPISLNFGDPDPSGQPHKGLDFAAPAGSPITAPVDGVIESAGWNDQGYGNLVIIDTADHVRVLMAHLASIAGLQPGQPINAGDPVGTEGATGNATGPHLHLEIRQPPGHLENAVDPQSFFNGSSANSQTDDDLFSGIAAGATGAVAGLQASTGGETVQKTTAAEAGKSTGDGLTLFSAGPIGAVKLPSIDQVWADKGQRAALLTAGAMTIGGLMLLLGLGGLIIEATRPARETARELAPTVGAIAGGPAGAAAGSLIASTSHKQAAGHAGRLVKAHHEAASKAAKAAD